MIETRQISPAVFLLSVLASAAPAQEQPPAIQPPFIRLEVPSAGFSQPDPYEPECDREDLPDSLWQRVRGEYFDGWIAARGPSGSGRYWHLAVGITREGEEIPTGGLCLTTSTLGWRTLRSFKRTPLSWLSDENGDGTPEFILWASFPLAKEASNAEFGLVGWVYVIDETKTFALDRKLTGKLASEIADAYEHRNANDDPALIRLREKAATMLRDLARHEDDDGKRREP